MPRSRSYDDADPEPLDPQEEAYKRAGLAASNAELAAKPQGFLESFRRLGEGNIDQPGSEAYNKYGAGRGRALEAAKAQPQPQTLPAKAAVTPSQMPAYPGRVADRRADIQNENAPSETALMKRQALSAPSMGEDKRSDMDNFQGMRMPTRPGQETSGMPTSRAPTSGAPIVTKEELAASGMSLRDYLNAKNRGKSAPPPGSSNAPSKALMPNKEGQPGGSVPTKRPRGQGTVMEQGRGVDLYGGSLNSLSDLIGSNKKSIKRGGGEYAKGGSIKKMASGGSASKRGDGIAQRGKTKGRLC